MLNEIIRERRKQLGIKQFQLAATLGISRQFMNDLESGSRRFSESLICKLAKALDLNEDYLFYNAGLIPPDFRAEYLDDIEQYGILQFFAGLRKEKKDD